MKILIATLALLSISISCFADITIDDLPYIEGTPLVERVDDIPVWSVLDYAEEDGVVQWAWLDKAGFAAYVVYPSDHETLLPNNSLIPASDHMLTLRFIGENQKYSFSRYGGDLGVSGDEITFSYTAPDKLYLVDGDSTNGDLFIEAEDIQLGGIFDGRFRNVTLSAPGNLAVPEDEDPTGSELSGNSGSGSTICPGSSVTISSDPSLYVAGSACLIGGDLSSAITPPDIIRADISDAIFFPDLNLSDATPCRLPEPHEYTGDKKVLCGENWLEASDEQWADMIAYSGASYLEEVPQKENPPKKKKSKGGSVPFSVLQLLLLVLISQRWSHRRLPH